MVGGKPRRRASLPTMTYREVPRQFAKSRAFPAVVWLPPPKSCLKLTRKAAPPKETAMPAALPNVKASQPRQSEMMSVNTGCVGCHAEARVDPASLSPMMKHACEVAAGQDRARVAQQLWTGADAPD